MERFTTALVAFGLAWFSMMVVAIQVGMDRNPGLVIANAVAWIVAAIVWSAK